MKNKDSERYLQNIYKALNLLRSANENIKEARELVKRNVTTKNLLDQGQEAVSEAAFSLLKISEKEVKR